MKNSVFRIQFPPFALTLTSFQFESIKGQIYILHLCIEIDSKVREGKERILVPVFRVNENLIFVRYYLLSLDKINYAVSHRVCSFNENFAFVVL